MSDYQAGLLGLLMLILPISALMARRLTMRQVLRDALLWLAIFAAMGLIYLLLREAGWVT